MHPTVILDIRYTVIGRGHPTLEILRGLPVLDERGAVIDFEPSETWEDVRFDEFANHAEYTRSSEGRQCDS